jgi:hypothetical protein
VPPQAEDVELEQLQEEHEAARALAEQAYDGGLGGYDPILLEPEPEEEFGAGEPATPPQIAMKMKVNSARRRRAAVCLLSSAVVTLLGPILGGVPSVGGAQLRMLVGGQGGHLAALVNYTKEPLRAGWLYKQAGNADAAAGAPMSVGKLA